MFIGSSTEGLPVARALQAELEYDVDASVWSQGVFGLSASPLETLVEAAASVDFAVFVLTPDDLLERRGLEGEAPRDNVIFEAGLFIGALGHHSTFLVSCREDHLALPTDLAGITPAHYNRRDDIQAAIGPAATAIRSSMDRVRRQRNPVAVPRAAFESPEHRTAVAWVQNLSGRSGGVVGESELWAVVVTRSPERRYHPQGGALALASDGRFEGRAYVGNEESRGTVELLLVIVGTSGSADFRQYQAEANKAQNWMGLRALPDDARTLDAISVSRS
jgi:Predicted nucleotide-binding protein containing TIR-like domain